MTSFLIGEMLPPTAAVILRDTYQCDSVHVGAQAQALARCLNRWSQANPDPYIGAHWPTAQSAGQA